MASVLDMKSKEEKDAELDRKIEALRKKNEALVRRHQMIEEDRRMAEQEGIAVTTPRKSKHLESEPDKARKEKENFSITLEVSAGEKRAVNDGKSPKALHTPPRSETSPRSPTHRTSSRTGLFSGGRSPQEDKYGEPFKGEGDGSHPSERATRGRRNQVPEMSRRSPRIPNDDSHGERWSASPRGAERGGRGPGRGGGVGGRGGGHGGPVDGILGPDRKVKEWEEKRKQNIEKMNEEMEQIAEYERSRRDGVREKNPIRNFLDDPRRAGPILEVDRKEGSRRHIRNWGGPDFEKVKTGMDREKESHGRSPGGKNRIDMSMTGKERAEYVRWKQERDQIDQERLARHKKPTGQWRREWDLEKTDSMFKEGAAPHVEEEPFSRRDQGKRGAPKPPTMAEFLPQSLKRPTQRRNPNRGRAGNKPYSMHDSRWEEDDDVGNEEEQPLSLEEKEKETCVEKTETKKAEEPQTRTPEVSAAGRDDKENKRENKSVEDDCEEDEEWTDASEDEEDVEEEEEEDSLEAEEDLGKDPDKTPQASATPKEKRLPKDVVTPKLTMPPHDVNTDDRAVETKPTSPFSPEGHRPVTDWGEEMELLSPPGSGSEDSPPQAVSTRGFSEDSKSQENSSPSGSAQNQTPALDPVKNLTPVIESESVHCTETKTNMEPKSPERLPERNVETRTSPEETSPAAGETSPVEEATSPSHEVTSPAAGETSPVEEATSLSHEVTSPAAGETSPVEEATSPSHEVTSPAAGETSPVEEATSPSHEVTSPAAGETSPVEEATSLSHEVTSPAAGETSPVEEVTFLSHEVTSLAAGETSPVEEETSLSHEVTSPAAGETSPVEEETSLSHEVTSPAAGETSPVKEEISLSHEVTAPAQEGTSLAEDGTSPAEEGTSPAEESSSFPETVNSLTTEETSPAAVETPPSAENSSTVLIKAQNNAQETSQIVEVLEGAAKSVHIADYETQIMEVPPSS
ncbi:coiled-coil domain-containing protein 9 [Bufo gargarizans]|uniref:coiled-coil domain-containing protein 9 n=1 Tax=Bufo gargarizans TaxID=30331 RepID=UPI001CF3E453|nr:coiled-coil domain-containing protein 9 [Bufo gargarizans]XP_044161887.1 coiled-coil domain-containing protein 9 [Bufo gargarizans]